MTKSTTRTLLRQSKVGAAERDGRRFGRALRQKKGAPRMPRGVQRFTTCVKKVPLARGYAAVVFFLVLDPSRDRAGRIIDTNDIRDIFSLVDLAWWHVGVFINKFAVLGGHVADNFAVSVDDGIVV